MLAFGLALCVGLLAAHNFSGLAAKLAANRDIKMAFISDRAPRVFIYHSFSKTVTVVNLPPARLKSNGSNYQKACAALALVSGRIPGQREDVFYLVTDAQSRTAPGRMTAPEAEARYRPVPQAADLSVFYATLNFWRSRPRLFFEAARRLWLLKKEERTNISFHDLLLSVLELSRLNSSNFIIMDFERGTGRGGAGSGAVEADDRRNIEAGAAAVIRVEVLNASGKKDLAAQVTKYLRKKGFDVINFGTYGSAVERTKIVNYSGNTEAEAAKAVRSALRLTELEIYSKPSPGGVAEVSVILGVDFNGTTIKERVLE